MAERSPDPRTRTPKRSSQRSRCPIPARSGRGDGSCSRATSPAPPIPRADVAATIAAALETGAASRTQFDVVSGDDPIVEALAALA